MKLRANPWLRLGSHGVVFVLLVSAAAVSPATALDLGGNGQAEFCAGLSDRSERVDRQIAAAQNDVRTAWRQQSDRYKALGNERSNNLSSLRSTMDAQRDRNLDKLQSEATTNSQKAAVVAYRTAQAQAMTTRRAAVSQADKRFTDAVGRLITARQAVQAGQVEALRITVGDALQTAAGQCAADVSPAAVMKDYTASIQASRQTFLGQRQKDSAISTQVAALDVDRRQAVTAANHVYQTTMDRARHILQAASGQSE